MWLNCLVRKKPLPFSYIGSLVYSLSLQGLKMDLPNLSIFVKDLILDFILECLENSTINVKLSGHHIINRSLAVFI